MSQDVAKSQEELPVKGIRSFRSNVDVENFYRFVHENNLRREAKMLLDIAYAQIVKSQKKRKKRNARKLQ